ncbi:MAG: GGDEF domain-containing protein, partial [Lysobacteraceae bacterium]
MASNQHDTTQRTSPSSGPQPGGSHAACVVVIHGEALGKRLDIGDSPVSIGRSAQCDLSISHRSISRRHCQIWRDDGRYLIRDLGSTNHTRVNDAIVEQAELRDGDHITLGDCILKFISQTSVEARYHEEIYQLATHDPLTGLFNRRHFAEILDSEAARAQRRAPRAILAILDLDHFKRINDRHGHIEGDAVLKQLADILRQHVRAGDVLARIGGEEFAVLMPDTDMDQALLFAERVRNAIATARFTPGGNPHPLLASLGLAALDPPPPPPRPPR